MKQTDRITYYEEKMERVQKTLEKLKAAAEETRQLEGDVKELKDYYSSKQWKKDFADDEQGKLPADLKRGVLSEDGLYDLLAEYDELIGILRE